MTRPHLLVPVDVSDHSVHPVTETAAAALAGFDVTLLGYWPTDDPETARADDEAAARSHLYETAALLNDAGAVTTTRLVFGPADERDAEREQVAAAVDADAVVIPGPLTALREVLVPLRDERRRDEILDVVAALDPADLVEVELYHAAESDARAERMAESLREVRSVLVDRGFPEAIVTTTIETSDDPLYSLGQRARDREVTVLGATTESDAEDRIFGSASDYVADETGGPVIVVRA